MPNSPREEPLDNGAERALAAKPWSTPTLALLGDAATLTELGAPPGFEPGNLTGAPMS